MRRVDFTLPGGIPLTQGRIKELQDTYMEAINALTRLAGNNCIVSGCTESAGGMIAAGWVILNGELLPFKGGAKLNRLYKKETAVASAQYGDGQTKNVTYEVEAAFIGTSPAGSVLWSNIKPIDTLTTLSVALASHTGNKSNPHGVTKAQIGLGNASNTSDANKPVSTATQAALNALDLNLSFRSDLIKLLGNVFGNNYILYGCELSGSNRTAGAVVIGGELMPFEAGANATKVQVTGEAAKRTLKAKCASTGTIDFAALRRIPASVKAAPQPKDSDWVTCTPTTDISVTQTIQCRINDRGRVEIRGRFRFVGYDYHSIFTIPTAFRPKYNRVSFALQATGNTNVSALLRIQASGRAGTGDADPGTDYILNSEYEL